MVLFLATFYRTHIFTNIKIYPCRLWFSGRTGTIDADHDMPRASSKTNPPAKRRRQDNPALEKSVIDDLAEKLRHEVETNLGPDATYEQRRDYEAELRPRSEIT